MNLRLFHSLTLLMITGGLLACSSAKKKEEVELSRYQGKKIALVQVDAEKTAKLAVEVALINQIARRGTFIVIPRQEYDKARAKIGVDSADPNLVARSMGADYSLRVRLEEFEADETKGFSEEEVFDEQLAEERGKEGGKTKRIYPVKALEGKVRAELTFTDLSNGDIRAGEASATDRVEADARTDAIHLPPKMSFLSALTEKAFQDFFDRFE